IGTIFYWVTNPLWIGGALAFIRRAGGAAGVSPTRGGGGWGYVFQGGVLWGSAWTAVRFGRGGEWGGGGGGRVQGGLVAFFSLTVVIYAIENGVQGIDTGGLKPTTAGLLSIVPLVIFSLVGFEAPNGAAEEMTDPQRDVPPAIFRTGFTAALCYLLP